MNNVRESVTSIWTAFWYLPGRLSPVRLSILGLTIGVALNETVFALVSDSEKRGLVPVLFQLTFVTSFLFPFADAVFLILFTPVPSSSVLAVFVSALFVIPVMGPVLQVSMLAQFAKVMVEPRCGMEQEAECLDAIPSKNESSNVCQVATRLETSPLYGCHTYMSTELFGSFLTVVLLTLTISFVVWMTWHRICVLGRGNRADPGSFYAVDLPTSTEDAERLEIDVMPDLTCCYGRFQGRDKYMSVTIENPANQRAPDDVREEGIIPPAGGERLPILVVQQAPGPQAILRDNVVGVRFVMSRRVIKRHIQRPTPVMFYFSRLYWAISCARCWIGCWTCRGTCGTEFCRNIHSPCIPKMADVVKGVVLRIYDDNHPRQIIATIRHPVESMLTHDITYILPNPPAPNPPQPAP